MSDLIELAELASDVLCVRSEGRYQNYCDRAFLASLAFESSKPFGLVC